MKKYLLAMIVILSISLSSLTLAAGLSSRTVDGITTKLSVMMEKEPEKFEMFVRKFYELLDRLPEKKIQQLLPLLEKVNVLVDQYNAKAIAKNNETLKTSPVNTNIETKISTGDLETLKSLVTYEIVGSSDIVLLEFSDFECPFCKRHHNNGTIKDVMKAYSGSLSKAFMHYPLSFHPLAEPTAIAAECVKTQAGKDGYYSFIDKVFTTDLTTANVEKIVKGFSTVDFAKYNACITDEATKDMVTKQMDFGLKAFKVRGTPSNIILNIKTGEYIMVSGAVPAQMIIDEVKKFLK